MISGRDFIIISSIEWNFLWQGPQEIASRLARAGNRVLYIENTGVRAPTLSDSRRIASRIINWAGASVTGGLRTAVPNLHVCSPVVLPPFGRSWQQTVNRRILLPMVCRAGSSLQMRDPVIITFLPTDTAVDLIHLLRSDAGAVVYYCVADFAELASHPARLLQSERELLGLTDLVLAQCNDLASRCSPWAENIHIIPFGVNLESISPETVNPGNAAEKRRLLSGSDKRFGLAHLPRPIIGYVGGLHRHLDLTLLTAMAQARPDWSWICVGPEYTPLGKLARLPNVHLPGEFRHSDLARQIEHFDIGIVPYVSSAFTNTVVPTKINEYLAMGKAVVSTALPAVRDYYPWRGHVVTSEPQSESFIAAIEQALAFPNDEVAKARRREVAALSDWQTRLEHICELIESVDKTRTSRIETAPVKKSAHA